MKKQLVFVSTLLVAAATMLAPAARGTETPVDDASLSRDSGNSITISDSEAIDLTLFSGTANLDEDITITANVDVALDIACINAETSLNVAADKTLTLNLIGNNSGAGVINKLGDGFVEIFNGKSYHGKVNAGSGGTVTYHSEGANAATFAVQSGGTLNLVANGSSNLSNLSFSTATGDTAGTLNLSGGRDFVAASGTSFSGTTVNIESGSFYGYQSLNLDNVSVSGAGTLNTNTGNDSAAISFSGISSVSTAITGGGSIAQNSGSLTLSGDNNYTGGTTVAAGAELVIAGTQTFSNSSLTVAEGGTLKIAPTGNVTFSDAITLAGNFTTESGAVLNLGGATASVAGLTINGTATINEGTIFNFDSLATGTYQLISASGLDAAGFGVSNLKVNGLSLDQQSSVTFSFSDNVLTLNYVTAGDNLSLTGNSGEVVRALCAASLDRTESANSLSSQNGDSPYFVMAVAASESGTTYKVGGTTIAGNNNSSSPSDWSQSYLIADILNDEETSSSRQTVLTTSEDKIIFTTDVSGFFGAWANTGNNATLGDIEIRSGKTVTITAGGSSSYLLFTGAWTGSGSLVMSNSSAVNNCDYVFAGDMSNFAGNITHANAAFNNGTTDLGASGEGVLQFGAATAALAPVATNISGTGAISTTGVLRYNYSGVPAGSGVSALTIGNSSITAKFLEFKGGANYAVSGPVNISNGGTILFCKEIVLDKLVAAGENITLKSKNSTNENKIWVKELSGTGTLVLESNANTSYCAVFSLGGGVDAESGFSGDINLKATMSNNNDRRVALVVNDNVAAANARINFIAGTTTQADCLEFGVGGDNVKIAGLNNTSGLTAVLYSNDENNTGNGRITSDGTRRNLEISTAVDNSFDGGFLANTNLNISKTGSGSQAFTGAIDAGTSFSVSEGLLTLTNAPALTDLTVGAKGTFVSSIEGGLALSGNLDLAGTVSLTGAISLTTGTIKLSNSVVFLLDNWAKTGDENSREYVLVSGGTLAGDSAADWASLTNANFRVDGEELSSRKSVSVVNGTATITGKVANLVWGGGATGTWIANGENSSTWTLDGVNNHFENSDNVTFGTNGATVSLGSEIRAKDIAVNESVSLNLAGYDFSGNVATVDAGKSLTISNTEANGGIVGTFTISGDGSFEIGSNVAVKEGAVLTIDANGSFAGTNNGQIVINAEKTLTWANQLSGSATIDTEKISNAGTLKVTFSDAWANTLTAASLSGTLEIAGGKFTITGSDIGSAKYLLDTGVHFQVSETKTISNSIEFAGTGTHELHTNGTNTLTFSGDVTVDSGTTLAKNGGGTLVFSNTANISGTLAVLKGTVKFDSTSSNYTTAGTRYTVNKVSLANNTTLETVGQGYSFNEVALAENATATLKLADTDNVLNQQVTIKELTGTGTLNLISTVTLNGAQNAYYVLGDGSSSGSFSGILAISNQATAGSRKSSVQIADTNIAKGAVISFDSSAATGQTHTQALIVSADTVKIAGLLNTNTGNYNLVSAAANTNSFTNDGTARTLEITGTGTYSYSGLAGSETNSASLNLKMSGAGTQTFSGTNNYFGDVAVSAGMLKLAGTTDVGGMVTVSGGALSLGGTATLSGGLTVSGGVFSVLESANITLSGTIDLSSAISNSGTIAVDSNAVFVLDHAAIVTEQDGTRIYTLIEGGTIDGWNTLAGSNFLKEGSTLGGRQVFDVDTTAGVVKVSGVLGIVWNGTESSNSWNTMVTNTNWNTKATTPEATAFISASGENAGDNVFFTSAGCQTVNATKNVTASSIVIQSGNYTFTADDDCSITMDNMTIDDGASLTFAGSVFTSTNSIVNNGTLNMSDATFEGTNSGTMNLSGSSTFSGTNSKVLNLSGTTTFSGTNLGTLNIAAGTTTFTGTNSGSIVIEENGTMAMSIGSTSEATTLTFSNVSGTGTIQLTPVRSANTSKAINLASCTDFTGTVVVVGGSFTKATGVPTGGNNGELANSELATIYSDNINKTTFGTSAKLAFEKSVAIAAGANEIGAALEVRDGSTLWLVPNSNATFTFSGAVEVKNGGSMISGNNIVNFTNTVTIEENGIWEVRSGTTNLSGELSGSGTLTLVNGTLNIAETANISSVVNAKGGTLSVTSGAVVSKIKAAGNFIASGNLDSGVLTVSEDSTITTSNGKNFQIGKKDSFAANITIDKNVTLTKSGSNQLILNNPTISGSGTFKVTDGDVFLNWDVGAGTSTAAIVVEGGNFNLNGQNLTASNFTLGEGGTLRINGDDSTTSTLILTGDSRFAGTVSSSKVSLDITGGTTTIAGANSLANSAVTVGTGATLSLGVATASVGSLAGTGTISKTTEGTATLTATSSSFTGTIESGVKLIADSISGNLNLGVDAGATLNVNALADGASVLLTSVAGTVNVSSGASVKIGTNSITGTITATDTDSQVVLTKTITTAGTGSITLTAGAKLVIDGSVGDYDEYVEPTSYMLFSLAPTETPTGETKVLNIVASSAINGLDLANVSLGDDFVSSLSGAEYEKFTHYTFGIEDENLILTLSIPEPSAFGLLAGLGALALAGTRRRRKVK